MAVAEISGVLPRSNNTTLLPIYSSPPHTPTGELVFVYRPLISLEKNKGDGDIKVYHHQGRVYSEVNVNGETKRLGVRGYPTALRDSTDGLKRFFSFTHLVMEKSSTGELRYVTACVSGPGRGLGDYDIFPMQTGYGLGGIIKKDQVRFATLKKRSAALENDLKNLEVDKAKLKADVAKTTVPGSTVSQTIKDGLQSKMTQVNKQITALEKEFTKVCKEMEALGEKIDFLAIEETLPIDHAASKVRIQKDKSYSSERLDHVMISKRDAGEVRDNVERFVNRLFAQDIPANFLPPSTIDGVVSNIEDMLQRESVISLVGSVITLTRSRVYDPIVFRPKARVSEGLKSKVDEYYVLTESVLGAVFIGFGKHISGTEGKEKEKEKEKPAEGSDESKKAIISSLTMISFVSQGAIPQTSAKADDANLWNVYTHWKEVLDKDEMSGYPIGFKYRELRDVLTENRIALPDPK